MTTPWLVNYHANPDDHNRYSPSCVRTMLQHSGLAVEHLKAHGNWLAVTGYAAGFATDEISAAQLDAPDWLEGKRKGTALSGPYELTVVAIGRKPAL